VVTSEPKLPQELPLGYSLRLGSGLDQALLLKFLSRTYREVDPAGSSAHLAQTVAEHFSGETPLWWVECAQDGRSLPVACLWMGTAIDQRQGDRHTYIFLLYVIPEHRRQGIGTVLMQQAETWAKARGDRQISLQVFQANQPAVDLYQKLGFATQSLLMVKPLRIID